MAAAIAAYICQLAGRAPTVSTSTHLAMHHSMFAKNNDLPWRGDHEGRHHWCGRFTIQKRTRIALRTSDGAIEIGMLDFGAQDFDVGRHV